MVSPLPRIRLFALALVAALPAMVCAAAAAQGAAAADDTTDDGPVQLLQRVYPLGADPGFETLFRMLGVRSSLARVARTAALASYDDFDYDTATARLYMAHLLAPNNPRLLRLMGFAGKSAGHYELARDALRLAAIETPNLYRVWWWLGDVQRLLGKYDASVESMRRAQALAPAEMELELGGFVEYSQILAGTGRDWEHAAFHAEFADRHKDNRRARRAIAELRASLDLVPDFAQENTEAWAQIAWLHSEMGHQYAFLQERRPAIYHFEEAAALYATAGRATDRAQQYNNLADCHVLEALKRPDERDVLFDRAIAVRERAYALFREVGDPQQERYTLGRLVEDLVTRHGPKHPRIEDLQPRAEAELPRQGPVDDFSLVAVALGLGTLRMEEGDLGGARVAFEMVMAHLDESRYLEDTLRAARVRTTLSRIYYEQGHYSTALELGDATFETLQRVRDFIHAEAIHRSIWPVIMADIACGLVRAAIASDAHDYALHTVENYRSIAMHTLLGGAVAEDALMADQALEVTLSRARVRDMEAALMAAHEADDLAAVARLEQRLTGERAWGQQLRQRPRHLPTRRQLARAYPWRDPALLRESLPEDVQLVSYLMDRWGGCVLVAGRDTVHGALLPEASAGVMRARVKTLPEALERGEAGPVLDALGAALLDPIAAWLEAQTVYVAPEGVLWQVPFDLLHVNGQPLMAGHDVGHVLSGKHLLHALEATVDNGKETFVCRAEDGCTPSTLREAAEPGRRLHLEAPLSLPPDNVAAGAFLLDADDGDDGRMHLAGLLARPLPLQEAVLCLDGAWAGDATGGDAVRTLVQTFAHGGVPGLVFNLWPAECGPMTERLAGTPLSAASVSAARRALAEADTAPATWAGFVFYGARP